MKSSVGTVGHGGRATGVVATLVAMLFVAGCGAASTPTPAVSSAPTSSATASTGAAASFTPPKLAGATIRIAVGATPTVSDTNLAVLSQILQSWGATSTIINQADDPAAVRAVLAGDAEVTSVAISTIINSGLVTFGPSQPRLDYHFIGAPSLKTVADLPGHIYGLSNLHGVEGLMFADLIAKNHIAQSSVTIVVAGGASQRVAAMLAHHIDAAFVHFDQLANLISGGFNDLAKMAEVAPELADSTMGASPAWMQGHPDLAVAVDEAWILAAQTFDTNKDPWVSAAVKYAAGTTADASATYDGLLANNTWPATKDAFTSASASTQETLASQVAAINTTPALSVWFTEAAWDQAVTALNLK